MTFTITLLFWAARDPTGYVYSEVILKELRVKTSRQRIDFGATFVYTKVLTLQYHHVLISF